MGQRLCNKRLPQRPKCPHTPVAILQSSKHRSPLLDFGIASASKQVLAVCCRFPKQLHHCVCCCAQPLNSCRAPVAIIVCRSRTRGRERSIHASAAVASERWLEVFEAAGTSVERHLVLASTTGVDPCATQNALVILFKAWVARTFNAAAAEGDRGTGNDGTDRPHGSAEQGRECVNGWWEATLCPLHTQVHIS